MTEICRGIDSIPDQELKYAILAQPDKNTVEPEDTLRPIHVLPQKLSFKMKDVPPLRTLPIPQPSIPYNIKKEREEREEREEEEDIIFKVLCMIILCLLTIITTRRIFKERVFIQETMDLETGFYPPL